MYTLYMHAAKLLDLNVPSAANFVRDKLECEKV